MSAELSTRDRLLSCGMQLFAEKGFKSTTVGEIEEAAGLQPRRGALYKHFRNKEALLEAAVERYFTAMVTAAEQIKAIDVAGFLDADEGPLRLALLGLGRWFLFELDNQRALTHVLEHDGPRLVEVAAAVREQIIDLGYGAGARLLGSATREDVDIDGYAVVLLGSLVAARRTAWTFGAPPFDIDDDRLLNAWADTCLAVRTRLITSGVSSTRGSERSRRRGVSRS